MSVTEYRMGKPKTSKDKPLKTIRQNSPNEPMELTAKLAKADTAQAKRELVSLDMGGLFYAFGEKRKAWQGWLSYQENMGEENGTKTTK